MVPLGDVSPQVADFSRDSCSCLGLLSERGGKLTFRVLDDPGGAGLHDGDARVSGSEIDTNNPKTQAMSKLAHER